MPHHEKMLNDKLLHLLKKNLKEIHEDNEEIEELLERAIQLMNQILAM